MGKNTFSAPVLNHCRGGAFHNVLSSLWINRSTVGAARPGQRMQMTLCMYVGLPTIIAANVDVTSSLELRFVRTQDLVGRGA